MNRKRFLKIAALLLAAMLALCACSVQNTEAETPQENAQTGQDISNQTEQTAQDETIPAAQTSETVEAGGPFSKRDLSGEYYDTVVTITLGETPTSDGDSDAVTISGQVVTISASGTYILSGTLKNGYIIVDAEKDDKVQLVLDGVSITSASFAAIYVRQADKVFITLKEGTENTLINGGSYKQIDSSNVDGVIFSKDDLTINGKGSLAISAPVGHGVVTKDDLVVADAALTINAEKYALCANDSVSIASGSFNLIAGKDGIHAEKDGDDTVGEVYILGGTFVVDADGDAIQATTILTVDGGTLQLSAAEGFEATCIRINGGDISITATDDGVNGSRKSSLFTPSFTMTDGKLTIVVGPGDTDGIDINGNISISGGTIDITGNSTFDYDGTAEYTGGTIILNGEQVDSIPNQTFGGMGGFGGQAPGGQAPGDQAPGGKGPGNGQFPGGQKS